MNGTLHGNWLRSGVCGSGGMGVEWNIQGHIEARCGIQFDLKMFSVDLVAQCDL